MELFDTHVHLDAEAFEADLDAVMERAKSSQVTRFVSIGAGYGLRSMESVLKISERYPAVWCSVGLHPHDANEKLDVIHLTDLARHERVVAIGETGLDFFKEYAPRAQQEEAFRAQIAVACEVGKPLVIHSRNAGEECYRMLVEEGAAQARGVFHCYSENSAFAARLRDIGFMVSIPGSVTFKKNQSFRDTVRQLPIEQIMLETDGPYLAPEPYRGKRCESAFMLETARVVAGELGVPLEELARQTTENALRFFRISP